MTTSEERMKILKMIQDSKITAEEGAKLLAALSTSGKRPSRKPPRVGGAQWLRVRVTDMASGKTKVNVKLPLKLVNAGVNIAAQFTPDMDLDSIMNAINSAINDNLIGKIVDVIDDEDGEHVEIFID